MPSDVEMLISQLRTLDVTVEKLERETNRELFDEETLLVCVISGGPLENARALLKATGEIANVAFWVRHPPNLSVDQRLMFAHRLLRLNFSIRFGRVSMVGYSAPAESGIRSELIFAETMFFWQYASTAPENLQNEIRRRLTGLVALQTSIRAEITAITGQPPAEKRSE